MTTTTSRRDFVRASAVVGGGFMLGFHVPAGDRLAKLAAGVALAEPWKANAWIRLASDGAITIVVDRSEMGQGVNTSLPMIIADEMDADWSNIRIEHAPVDPVYNNYAFGMQATGGSSSIPSSWKHFRQAGAAAREMLVAAAAAQWSVDASTCTTSNSVVTHSASGRSAAYKDLASAAASMPVPKEPKLKDPKDFKIIGTRTKRLDTPLKVNGTAGYGIDAKVPGMLVAVLKRPPVFDSKYVSHNDTKAKAVKGVRHVFPLTNGVAVVADGYYAATKGRDALTVKWNEGANATNSTTKIKKLFREAAKKTPLVPRNDGDVAAAIKGAAKRIDAEFDVPPLAHCTMEPMNCTADIRADGADIYVPTQRQDYTRALTAQITGLKPETINVHTTYLGGGFGRKFDCDFVQDAVEASFKAKAPVKMIFSREDDIQHDFYRTAAYTKVSAGLDADGWPVAWDATLVSSSSFHRIAPMFLGKDGLDGDAVGGAVDLPYAIPNVRVAWVHQEYGVPPGFWRGVGVTQNSFVAECFIDELASAAKKDPVEYRRKLLANKPRHLGVLNLAAEKSGWGSPLPMGRYRGVAVQDFSGTLVAEVAEVSVTGGKVKVHRVVCAIDCGQVINPDTIEAQCMSGIIYGLQAALYGEIVIENGRVKNSNFHDYPMIRMAESPAIETYIVPSSADPSGVGEPPVPPLAPAVANAVFAATGQRIRSMPIKIAMTTQAGARKKGA